MEPGLPNFDTGAAARERRRRRRGVRALAVVTLVVAAAVAVAIPVALAARRSAPTSVDAGVSGPVPPGWRTESWHGVTLQVPSSWGYACPGPMVSRAVREMPACDPYKVPLPAYVPAAGVALGSGRWASSIAQQMVAFTMTPRKVYSAWTTSAGHLDGADTGPRYVGAWSGRGVAVEVRANDPATVRQVLGSIRILATGRTAVTPGRSRSGPPPRRS